jgi:predicted secreted protein
MGWFTGVVLYALIWWTTLFAVLPIGVVPADRPDPVTGWRGAPERPRIGRKLLITTLAAAVIWGACVAVIESPWLSFRHGWLALPQD